MQKTLEIAGCKVAKSYGSRVGVCEMSLIPLRFIDVILLHANHHIFSYIDNM